ncbi:unnamed protein product [Moneuplotes crassus]|uniref:Uncharacterized protein n=1 Tax=Euplotes crassus TaxID=5936 RepID=A0AAD2DAR0_EUPCR|nr:unnamed protein product [Moneuplotes crassus]
MKSFSSNQDIWADEDQLLSEDECSPQIPKITKQFCNTLKNNKGKANKADFERVKEHTYQSKRSCEKEGLRFPAPCLSKSLFKLSHARHSKSKSQNYGCTLSFSSSRMQPTQLRRIPSSDILKSLRA